MSDQPLTGQTWSIAGRTHELGESVLGAGPNSPSAFHYAVDFSFVEQPGVHELRVADLDAVAVVVSERPYAALANLPLQHLRMARSGTDTVLWRQASHPGDAATPLYVPEGNPSNGAWRAAESGRRVDVRGGWYDAGDHLKFTLTTAYTVYHLLLAHEIAPTIFTKVHSTSALPDILDEAKHGLDYLLKLWPDEDTFIVQVGDARDHNLGWRLPADDELDGTRPAMAALAQVPMFSTVAALAKGARTLAVFDEAAADRYAAAAVALFERARRSDTILTAFERDDVNDFYRDDSVNDQRALAALELAALTGEPRYEDDAVAHRPGRAEQVGWADWHWLAHRNLALAGNKWGAPAWWAEIFRYQTYARRQGQPWGQPTRYVWGSLTRWIGAANAGEAAAQLAGSHAERPALFDDMLDYVFGRNPWGASFLFDERLPNTLRHLYSPTAKLLERFPVGAFSAGPAGRRTHESMRRYFDVAPTDPFERFNTTTMVFYDNEHDFVCQEATIGGQADIVLMLALAAARTEVDR